MVDGDWLDVADAAEELEVSRPRVRQLIKGGELGAIQVAGRWAVPRALLEEYKHLSPPRGRPMTVLQSWRELLAGPEPRSPDQVDRWRRRLRVRADWQRYRVHPSGLKRLRADERVVLSGRDAVPVSYPVDPDPDRVIGYIRDVDLEGLVASLRLRPEQTEWNVELGVVDPDVWPFADRRVAHGTVAWIDLLDHRDRAAEIAAIAAAEEMGAVDA